MSPATGTGARPDGATKLTLRGLLRREFEAELDAAIAKDRAEAGVPISTRGSDDAPDQIKEALSLLDDAPAAEKAEIAEKAVAAYRGAFKKFAKGDLDFDPLEHPFVFVYGIAGAGKSTFLLALTETPMQRGLDWTSRLAADMSDEAKTKLRSKSEAVRTDGRFPHSTAVDEFALFRVLLESVTRGQTKASASYPALIADFAGEYCGSLSDKEKDFQFNLSPVDDRAASKAVIKSALRTLIKYARGVLLLINGVDFEKAAKAWAAINADLSSVLNGTDHKAKPFVSLGLTQMDALLDYGLMADGIPGYFVPASKVSKASASGKPVLSLSRAEALSESEFLIRRNKAIEFADNSPDSAESTVSLTPEEYLGKVGLGDLHHHLMRLTNGELSTHFISSIGIHRRDRGAWLPRCFNVRPPAPALAPAPAPAAASAAGAPPATAKIVSRPADFLLWKPVNVTDPLTVLLTSIHREQSDKVQAEKRAALTRAARSALDVEDAEKEASASATRAATARRVKTLFQILMVVIVVAGGVLASLKWWP